MTHDKDIREPLFDFLEEQYGKIRIIEEKTMGRSRADAVMVTDVRKKGNPGERKRLRSSRSRLFGSLWTALRIRLWDLRMILISP